MERDSRDGRVQGMVVFAAFRGCPGDGKAGRAAAAGAAREVLMIHGLELF